MKWKVKAAIQNAFAMLPEAAGNAAYYWMQRRLGGLRTVDPTARLQAGIDAWRHCLAQGLDPAGRTVLEVGTGHIPTAPLAYWLMGAGRVVTIDLNRYVHAELIDEQLEHIRQHRSEIEAMFGSLLHRDRLDALRDHRDVLRAIEYVAPGDAARTGLAAGEVAMHTSFTVFEHIPRNVLGAILSEAGRVLAPDGLLVHRIDYTDHFAHSDSSIPLLHFLRFDEREWRRYAANRFMYMNRMRHPEFVELLAGHQVLAEERFVAPNALPAELAPEFARWSRAELEITGAWLVSRPLTSKASSLPAA